MNAKDIIENAISLPVEERAIIVDSLLKSLNSPSEDLDREWMSVARRRLHEIRSGKQAAVPGDEVFGRVWKRFE